VEQLKSLDDQAGLYRKAFDTPAGARGPEPAGERNTEAMRKSYEAHDELYWYDRVRQMTNFPHFYFKSQVEALDETVDARRGFFEAEQLYRQGRPLEALELYKDAGAKWRKLLLAHADFADDNTVLEDTFEIQLKYVNLLQDKFGRRVRPLMVAQDCLAQIATRPVGVAFLMPPLYLMRERFPVAFVGPFDGNKPSGAPLIPSDLRLRVRQRVGMTDPLSMDPLAVPGGISSEPMPPMKGE
jgi:hypothetical protein